MAESAYTQRHHGASGTHKDIYVHDNWCNANIVDSHCVPDLEYLTVKCRPFYLPWEFTAVMVATVYVPPDAKTNVAQGYLLHTINSHQTTHPDAIRIIAGDLNHADLEIVLPKFHQHIKCATRRKTPWIRPIQTSNKATDQLHCPTYVSQTTFQCFGQKEPVLRGPTGMSFRTRIWRCTHQQCSATLRTN